MQNQNELTYELFDETLKFILPNIKNENEPADNLAFVLTANRNLQDYGFTMSQDMIEKMSVLPQETITENYNTLLAFCKEKKGDAMANAELFYPNFPREVMNRSDAELYLNAMIAYLSGAFLGENLHIHEVEERRAALIETFTRSPQVINAGTEADLTEMMKGRFFYGKVLPLNKRDQLFNWMSTTSVWKKWIKEKPIKIKENKIAIAKYIHDKSPEDRPLLKEMLKDSVDVLRYASAISHAKTNIELKNHVHFTLSSQDQKEIKSLLNNCKNLYFDIWTREGLFKSLGRACSMTKSVPKRLKKAYDNLCNGQRIDEQGKEISTTWIELNKAFIAAKENNYEKIEAFAHKFPGLYAKNFLAIMQFATSECLKNERFGTELNNSYKLQKRLAVLLSEVGEKVNPSVSLAIINEAKQTGKEKPSGIPGRVVCHNKKFEHIEDNREPYTQNILDTITVNAKKAAEKYYSQFSSQGKIYIDPDLKNIKIPSNQEKDMSKGSNMTQGSTKECIKEANIISVGIQWDVDCDIDAHAYFLDDNFRTLNSCSYFDLKTRSSNRDVIAVHSGDFTEVSPEQAKNGGVKELIFIDKKKCLEDNVRYAALYVHGYWAPGGFKNSNCQVSVMQREGSLNNFCIDEDSCYPDDNPIKNIEDYTNEHLQQPAYAAKTVDFNIKLNSSSSFCTPCIIDLLKDKIIWLDKNIDMTYRPQGFEGLLLSSDQALLAMKMIMDTPKPSFYDILLAYAKGTNSEIVSDKTKADFIITEQPIDRIKENIKEDARILSSYDLSVLASEFLTAPSLEIVNNEPEIEESLAEEDIIAVLQNEEDVIIDQNCRNAFTKAKESAHEDR